jgi:hypothetical protein
MDLDLEHRTLPALAAGCTWSLEPTYLVLATMHTHHSYLVLATMHTHHSYLVLATMSMKLRKGSFSLLPGALPPKDLVDGIQVHKVSAVSQSKPNNVWI